MACVMDFFFYRLDNPESISLNVNEHISIINEQNRKQLFQKQTIDRSNIQFELQRDEMTALIRGMSLGDKYFADVLIPWSNEIFKQFEYTKTS